MDTQKNNYTDIKYLYKGRWISYWYQIMETTNCENVHSILEVGPGNKIVTNALQQMGYIVKTIDSDNNVNPDYQTDIRNVSECVKETFDLVLCCQMLEHIPFDDVKNVLVQFRNISNNHLIVTLPYTSLGTFKPYVNIKLFPFLRQLRWIKIFNLFPRENVYNEHGGHYWEIGKKGYPLKKITSLFSETGWHIEKSYPIFENPYHYMFVLKKNQYDR